MKNMSAGLSRHQRLTKPTASLSLLSNVRVSGNLGVPVSLAVSGFDPAEDDLHGLAGQVVKLLRELEDLEGSDLLLLPNVNKLNSDPGKQAVAPACHSQDLHPAAGNRPVTTANCINPGPECNASDLWKSSSSCTAYRPPTSTSVAPGFLSAK